MKNPGKTQKPMAMEEGECEIQAAFTLLRMRETPIDADTAEKLRIQRRKIEKERRARCLIRERGVVSDHLFKKKNNFDGGLLGRQEKDNVGFLGRQEIGVLPIPGNDNHRMNYNGGGVSVQLPRYPRTQTVAQRIGAFCSEPFEKVLTVSDLKPHLHKLALTREKVHEKLLPMLETGDGNVVEGIEVVTYDWLGNEFPMKFKAWNGKKIYVLTAGWNKLLVKHRNTMTVQDRVVIWMFREKSSKGKICFALDLLKKNRAGDYQWLNQNVVHKPPKIRIKKS
ncbi:OLC1v1033912C1 [Oldenlandia corymbosa var. corymbosa]|uniref:OLC1v1033912C1 n=1 Tax=Oldenlandia corymbosa var. corymbosa TaxID=529605 RepID=A0AAV1CRZ3_OLDCO|nr:OLC1v1033912C1 [Oldenlandia corymbosa var. corymbosa]